MTKRMPLRQRVREAGGLYAWFNAWLISKAGPAAVGPYDASPPRPVARCPLCGAEMSRHEFDRSGPKPLMYCPQD